MSTDVLSALAAARVAGSPRGITSVCSAHPVVIEAALRHGKDTGGAVLVEATCNQVNQEGGYTGMAPAGFRDHVHAIARRIGLAPGRIVLGGDHLGPNPWRRLPAEEALRRAETMVVAYVEAGYEKLHLDTSMGCDGEASALPDELVAARAARLAVAAEAAAARMNTAPRYVIGTEVPVPGGAPGAVGRPEVTWPTAVRATHEAHRRAFDAAGAGRAFARVVALVVQPGVEFGNDHVAAYEPARARVLSATLDELPGIVFEAHSTDYQPAPALTALVRDGFAILKVGPALTFALREALYGLDHVAAALDAAWNGNSLRDAMESVMLANPDNWRAHYHGTPEQERWLRHYGYSDRIRYYWPAPAARTAVNGLLDQLRGTVIPEVLVSQYLSPLYPEVAAGALVPVADALLLASVRRILAIYATACRN